MKAAERRAVGLRECPLGELPLYAVFYSSLMSNLYSCQNIWNTITFPFSLNTVCTYPFKIIEKRVFLGMTVPRLLSRIVVQIASSFLQIRDILRQGIEAPEGQNDLKRMQLRELAALNGTLRDDEILR